MSTSPILSVRNLTKIFTSSSLLTRKKSTFTAPTYEVAHSSRAQFYVDNRRDRTELEELEAANASAASEKN